MFLLPLIQGQKACPHWVQLQGTPPSLGEWPACLSVRLWPPALGEVAGHVLWGPALFCEGGCLNLSFTFTSDISSEVVITNSMSAVIVWEARGPSWDGPMQVTALLWSPAAPRMRYSTLLPPRCSETSQATAFSQVLCWLVINCTWS